MLTIQPAAITKDKVKERTIAKWEKIVTVIGNVGDTIWEVPMSERK